MILICDFCTQITNEILKIPTSGFTVEEGKLFIIEDYINVCPFCLIDLHKNKH